MTDKELAMYIGQKIKDYRLLNGMTQKDLATKINMGDTTIVNYEKGIRTPKKNTLFKIAEVFNVSIDDFFPPISTKEAPETSQNDRDELLEELTTNYTKLDKQRKNKLVDASRELVEEMTASVEEELFEYHVYEKLSAGIGTAYFEDRNYDTVYFDEEIDHDLASWVYGDSMEPDYLNGSVALIKGTGFDYDGAIYAVDWDGQSYIKKVYKEKDGLRLVSLNKKYADKFAPYDEEPRIIGKIVGNFMPMEK
ncbi:MAG: S24 family peptidase [Streptococcus hyointestinalis]|uniref:helix-turn-helix domain-containing protein n=1 Tax=Streptococcus hyointestinalis TaxID=1337 RepID=UPI0023F48559|nr:S24 family peptidase [Streptococcus hyointestinalis]MDD7355725.1 S24 family peptidase [Streptococcus hyointestinalis]MDY4553709.1 S24 family peptidase [Streptococcus hyointestinalis]